MTNETEPTRCGEVALVGAPNAGKSTLLNRLIGEDLSIVTPVAQTTRRPVVGIDTSHSAQLVYVDTPGLLEPRYLLQNAMLHAALETIRSADAVVLIVDAAAPPPTLGAQAVEALRARSGRLLVALNKIDRADADRCSRAAAWADALAPLAVCRISAQEGTGVDGLRERLIELIPVSPFLFPPDEISSQSVRFFVTELIRETVLEQYHEEIPHSVFAEIEEFRESTTPVFIRATIYVERDSQKRILIGQAGSAIRSLGAAARVKIERFVGGPVYLDLWVKVLPKWRKHAPTLRRLGFVVPQPE